MIKIAVSYVPSRYKALWMRTIDINRLPSDLELETNPSISVPLMWMVKDWLVR